MESRADPLAVVFKRIVVATDFSEFAATALKRAAKLALKFHSTILLVHVMDPLSYTTSMDGVPFSLRESPKDVLTELEVVARPLRLAGIPCELAVRQGPVRESLHQLCLETHADLLVVSTHGRHRFDREVCSCVAEQILRLAPCPVMTVGPRVWSGNNRSSAKRILFATNYSSVSLRILPFVDAFAHHWDAELLLLNVSPDSSQHHNLEKLRVMARDQLFLAQNVRCLVRTGTPQEEIVAAAEENWADAILLGVHSEDLSQQPRGGLHLGLVYQIVSQTSCPVITLNEGIDVRALRATRDAEMMVAA